MSQLRQLRELCTCKDEVGALCACTLVTGSQFTRGDELSPRSAISGPPSGNEADMCALLAALRLLN